MIKCVSCTLHRTLVQKTLLRTLRTSSRLTIEETPPEKETVNTKLKVQKGVPNIPDEFKRVFNFPYIRHFALINKLKIYQTGLTAMFIAGQTILSQLSYLSEDVVQVTAIIGTAGCLTLYGLGYLTGNFIGFIYYNEKTNIVRIAYVDYWGRRKDLELPVDDIIPIRDLPVSRWNGLYVTFRRYSTNDTFKINTRFAIVIDKDALKKII